MCTTILAAALLSAAPCQPIEAAAPRLEYHATIIAAYVKPMPNTVSDRTLASVRGGQAPNGRSGGAGGDASIRDLNVFQTGALTQIDNWWAYQGNLQVAYNQLRGL